MDRQRPPRLCYAEHPPADSSIPLADLIQVDVVDAQQALAGFLRDEDRLPGACMIAMINIVARIAIDAKLSGRSLIKIVRMAYKQATGSG